LSFALIAALSPATAPAPSASAEAAGHALDPSFADDGRKTTALGGRVGSFADVAVQGRRLLIAATVRTSRGHYDFGVTRLRPDGRIDPSFGHEGFVRTRFGRTSARPSAIAVMPDRRFVIAGTETARRPPRSRIVLARYRPGGAPDPSFGDAGKVVTDLGRCSAGAESVVVAAGRIYVGGSIGLGDPWAESDALVAAYRADGSLDTSFSGDGWRRAGFISPGIIGGFASFSAVAAQPDGRIVAAGTAGGAGPYNSNVVLARFSPNGRFDHGLGHDGRVVVSFRDGPSFAKGLAIQPDGRAVVAGGVWSQYSSGAPRFFALLRLKRDGSLDASFGRGGRVRTAFTPDDTAGGYGDVALDASGRIVAAGTVSADSLTRVEGAKRRPYAFAVARYRPDGSLDPGFDQDGTAVTEFRNAYARGERLAIDAMGRIVVGGTVHRFGDGPAERLGIARYLSA
jgi:uncharacterized delta-60 repeat protein